MPAFVEPNKGSGLGGVGGRLVVCSFDPGEDTGWAWHCASKDSLLQKGTKETLREMRPDVELESLPPDVAALDLGMEHGWIGKGMGHSEDDQVDRMVDLARRCSAAYQVDFSKGDSFAIVTEDFILRESTMDRNLLAPVRLNAKLERDLRGIGMRFWLQSPSDAKNVVTDARLRLWNVYDAHSGKHARDAQRHGILFMRRWSSQMMLRKSLGSGAPRLPSTADTRSVSV